MQNPSEKTVHLLQPLPEKMGNRRYSEQEEALEIKSLRRIIAAYANYQDAAERDVKRYERSFKMLPPTHKELLCHLGLKYQRLRWCISMNAAFIMNMLEAFKPPFDMSQYVDDDGNEDSAGMHEHNHAGCVHSSEKGGDCSRTSISISNSILPKQHDYSREDAKTNEFSREIGNKKGEEIHMAGCSQPIDDNMPLSLGRGELCNSDKDVSAHTDYCSSSASDRVILRHCMPSLRLNVPPVDVDKVRWVIRNIVRDWAEEGQRERDECYKLILEELNRLFPNRSKQRPPSCLVPGAGLGRLALEISSLGFISQGNELSYYMLIDENMNK